MVLVCIRICLEGMVGWLGVNGFGRSYRRFAIVVKMISSFLVGRCPFAACEGAWFGCCRR